MVRIIRAKNDHRIFLSEVCKAATQFYNEIFPGAFEKQAKKFIEEGLPKNYDIGIVNIEDTKIGFIGLVELDDETLYLTALYLLSKYQRQGYGRSILDIVEKDAQQAGIKTIVVLVHSKATWATNFYNKNGYEVLETEESKIKKYADYRMANYALPSTILMEKKI